MKYSLVSVGDNANITVFVNGEMQVAQNTHPNFERIVEGAIAGDESIVNLFDVSREVAKRFNRVSERVSIAGGQVYFDGDIIDNALTKQIVRVLDETEDENDSDFVALVNFFERVAQNPSQHSREQFYTWLDKHKFAITREGKVVMYKGVVANGDGTYGSISRGPAIVDGEAVNGSVPNNPGSVVEIARGKVEFNPGVGCASGLHAGTWEYARQFAGPSGAVLAVHVDPRDVVSIPTDCEAQKVRTCRYFVERVAEGPLESAVYYDNYEDALDDDYDEYDGPLDPNYF